ncbi:DUF7282 domain-containing protein [Salinibaculum rarum]|uniref:DUF7282 domain-containing protein n=1 Tax=Salinibaculum rarum TaxID=3058903 RepID=UPI00266003C6|nr:BGTF surface domain-containing protein [Salinibaculum sp. KK48]
MKVNLPELEESGSGADDTRASGNVTVDVTSRVITEGTGENTRRTYQGEVVALQTNSNNGNIVIEEVDGSTQLDGSAPTNGRLLAYDTANLDVGGNYSVEFDGSTEYFQVNDLNLQASVESTEISEGDDIVVDVSAIRGGQDVTVELDGPDSSGVTSEKTKALGGNGEATFTFSTTKSDDNDDVGDYDITATDNPSGVSATTDTVTVVEAAETDAAFEEVETEQRGDVANITVSLTESDYATLTLGTDSNAFETNVTVYDENEDGEVTLQWNSFLADNRSANNPVELDDPYDNTVNQDDIQWTAVGDDKVTGTNVSTQVGAGPQHVIATGTYTMNVKAGQSTVAQADDRSTMTLTQRDSSSLQLWTAPQSASSEISELSDINDAIDAGTLTQTEEIANGDVLVAQISAEGLEGAFENQSRVSGGASEAWFNLTANETVTLKHDEQVGAGSNVQPSDITIDSSTAGAVNVIANADADTYYIIHDTSNINGIEADTTYDTVFNFTSIGNNTANYGLIAPNADDEFEDEITETSFDVVEGSATIDTQNDLIRVGQAAGQQITGTSTYAPGTELNLVIQSDADSSSQFVIDPESFEVAEDGTWSVTADFSEYNVGSTFTADLTKGGSDEDTGVEGEIRGSPEVLTLEFSDQERRGEVVAVDAVELNYGGFVAIHEGSASGDVIGVSSYIGENQATQNVRITLDEPLDSDTTLVAMPHLDTNNNEEFDYDGGSVDAPYTADGEAVTANAEYTIEGDDGETTPTTPTTPDETATPDEGTATPDEGTATPSDGGDGDSDGESGPGFGIMVSVLALLGAALLAARRNN